MKRILRSKSVKIVSSLILVVVLGLGVFNIIKNTQDAKLSGEELRTLTYKKVSSGDDEILGTDRVTFDAFFLKDLDNDGEADKVRGSTKTVGIQDKLWLELKVLGDVTLKDAKITFVNQNVTLSGSLVKDTVFANTIRSNNITSIDLNEINDGVTKLFYLNTNTNIGYNINNYTGTNKVILTGTVVYDSGEEVEITKEVEYTNDWYGDVRASIGTYKYESTPNAKIEEGEEEKVYNIVKYTINTSETKNQLLLKSANIEGVVTDFNGYAPVKVEVEGSNVKYEYDSDTRTIKATREAVVNDNGVVISSADIKNHTNEWVVTVYYPDGSGVDNNIVYLNLKTWYEGYNNQNEEFENVVKSNVATKILSAPLGGTFIDDNASTTLATSVAVGTYSYNLKGNFVDKTDLINLYNGFGSKTTEYGVNWNVMLREYKYYDNIDSIEVYEPSGDKINGKYSMVDFTKYKTLQFVEPEKYLGEDGTITLYNYDTKEVIEIFNKNNWNDVYTFKDDVRRISVTTSGIKSESFANKLVPDENGNLFFTLLQINFTKEIDNEYMKNIYTLEQAKEFSSIYSYTKTNAYVEGDFTYEETQQFNSAQYVEAKSDMKVAINKNNVLTNEDTNVNINITTNYIDEISRGWINGEYLIKLPEEILEVEIEDIDISNNNVNIVSKEIYKEGNNKFIRIITDNTEPKSYTITLDLKLTPDARITNKSNNIEVYGYNTNTHEYLNSGIDRYDLNNNSDLSDKIAYRNLALNFQAPNEIITAATLTNYDSEETVSVSPQIARIDPTKSNGSATVNVDIINNSDYSAKNIVVVGKLAYEGNKYQIGDADLHSEFDITLKSGIKVPKELEGKTTIYYSEKESPTQDISEDGNEWVLEPTDYSKIKSYMIIVNDYELYSKKTVTFTYDVNIPTSIENLKKTTYFNHGVYLDLITEAGDYNTSVGASKLGVRITRNYDLEITNKQVNSTKLIPNTRYIIESEDGTTSTITTDSEGVARLKGLEVNTKYKIKNYSTINDYELDEEEKNFTVYNDGTDLVLETEGNYKNIELVDSVLKVELENEVKFDLVLNAKDIDTNENVSKSIFKISGKGIDGEYTIKTDSNGKLLLNNLYINEEYVITQEHTNGYLIVEQFKIKLTRDSNNELKINIEKEPVFPELEDSTIDNYSMLKYNATSNLLNSSLGYTASGTQSGVFRFDLTEFKKDYKLSYSLTKADYNTSYYDTVKIYLTKDYTKPLPTPVYNSTSYLKVYNQLMNYTTFIDNTDGNKTVTLSGGTTFDLYVLLSKKGYTNFSLSDISIEPIDGITELVTVNELENVQLQYSDKVLQTLKIEDDEPVLYIDVKNKAVPTYTLKINKMDADTKTKLEGAQFKVEGYGLKNNYLTTDSNGVASIELYQSISSSEGLNGYNATDMNKYSNNYKVQEVLPPVGYTKDDAVITYNLTTTTVDNETKKYVYYTGKDKFKEYSYDYDNDILNVNFYDYPIASITKTDSETGALLPNTMFAVYSVTKENGNETIEPAIDVEGNIIGEKMYIDGENIYVVTTDDNGKISLNLPTGMYLAKEIQASDDKYEIDGEEYYFGIGESVPYQAKGIEYVDSYQLYNHNGYKLLNTSDGGYLISTKSGVVKTDKDFNMEWGYTPNINLNKIITVTKYFDSDAEDIREQTGTTNDIPTSISDIEEVSDGYYILAGDNYGYGSIVFKLDKAGNEVWNNREYYEKIINTYTKLCAGKGTPKKDDNYYYCGSETEFVNYFYEVDRIEVTEKEELIVSVRNFTKNNGSNVYSFELSDGTRVSSEYKDSLDRYFLKYDSKGNLVNVYSNYAEQFEKGIKDYYSKYGLEVTSTGIYDILINPQGHGFEIDDEGNIYYIVNDISITTKDLDTNNVDTFNQFIVFKFDKDFNLIKTMPLSFNGSPVDIYLSATDNILLKFSDDGGFYIESGESTRVYNNLKKLPSFEIPEEKASEEDPIHYGNFILKYDKDGNPVSAVEFLRHSYNTMYEQLYNNNERKRLIGAANYYNNIFNYIEVDDGYIVGLTLNFYNPYKEVILASGETIDFSSASNQRTPFMIYKVNNDSSIEWVRMYDSIYAKDYIRNYEMLLDSDNNLILALNAANTTINGYLNTENIEAETIGYNAVKFNLSDEVLPSGPESYNLKIENKRKKMKINVSTNEGGTVNVSYKGATIYESEDTTNSTVELVKYGDDSVYDINFKAKDGYSIESVLLNGEDTSYTINEDGSITLDKLENVTEEYNIEVKYRRGISSVIVHHYIKDTTTKIASDELITGVSLSVYETRPVVDDKYSLIVDENGNEIIPTNYTGIFDDEVKEVIYYYDYTSYKLTINYLDVDTLEEISPKEVKSYIKDSNYSVNSISIEGYKFNKVEGEESGVMDSDKEVTYYYEKIPTPPKPQKPETPVSPDTIDPILRYFLISVISIISIFVTLKVMKKAKCI